MLKFLRKLDRMANRLSRAVKEWLGHKPNWPILIAPYKGYGYEQQLVLRGRVIKDRRIVKGEANSTWRALLNNYKRFNSREVRGATVHIHVNGEYFPVQTDEEGYFFLQETLAHPLSSGQNQWHKVHLQLTETPRRKLDVRATGKVIVPGKEATFGFISDVDDTVLKTEVTSLLKLRVLYHTLLKSAHLRQSFGQAAAFFQALRCGLANEPVNPVFYVSNSPWNLYDLLEEFLQINNLPAGPILLRDFGLPYQERPEHYLGHKHSSIIRILETYPHLPFVLIGDSGEQDPYIYEAVARAYPERITAIYIRDVRSIRRARRIKRFIEETGVDMKLVQNYRHAAQDAADRGLLHWERFNGYKSV
jgi:phosphatidate phosphatase APP1